MMMKVLLFICTITVGISAIAGSERKRTLLHSLAQRDSKNCNSSQVLLFVGQSCDPNNDMCQENAFCSTVLGGRRYVCQALTDETLCVNDNDCGAGNYGPCLQGKCVLPALPGDRCSDNSGCASNECVSGFCAAKQLGQVCSGFDCREGLFCNASSGSVGVCTLKIRTGGSCSSTSQSVDAKMACQAGSFCTSIFNSATQTFNPAKCTAAFSVETGKSFISTEPAYTCKSSDYFNYNDNGYFTCQTTASCGSYLDCPIFLPTVCDCPRFGNGAGTCSARCTAQFSELFECVANLPYTPYNEYTQVLFNPQSNAYHTCGSFLKKAVCCPGAQWEFAMNHVNC